MSKLSLTLCLLALSMFALSISISMVRAQDARPSEPTQYDPILEKRADLRMKYVQGQRKAAKEAQRAKDEATPMRKHETRIDRSHLVDFMARSAKRADLRARISQAGMDAAYAEWMQREHGR
jgi:hypothetical protein